jgi:hypothetical protein
MKRHYLVLTKYVLYDDSTGTEHVSLRQQIRRDIDEASEQLAQHSIKIKDIRTENFVDHTSFDQVHGVALEFYSEEDLALAHIILSDRPAKRNIW